MTFKVTQSTPLTSKAWAFTVTDRGIEQLVAGLLGVRRWFPGVDTGGTFTDVVALSDDGRLIVRKTPSTPHDPSVAILNAVRMAEAGTGFRLVHGTTVATNALLERRGAKTALITTQGCRDVLEIGRQTRTELYSLTPFPRNPLIPRSHRFEITERLDWRGATVLPIDKLEIDRALDQIEVAGADSLAVCFLFSFLNPEHEQEVGRRARQRGLLVSLSSEIAPEFREYERTSTVCANAFVGPVMSQYVERLQEKLAAAGAGRLSIMQSNGGALRADEAAQVAVKTVLSGPAGGLIAATKIAQAAGFPRIIAFDMGGTSTDVALADGDPRTVRTGEVAGIPLLTPMLDIHTVGAGGGSIARIDLGGGLRVGPRSAGADPGPVAYGRGDELTVTDANVLLGRLPANARLAGTLPLDISRVQERFAQLAAKMAIPADKAAEGILSVVNANMARALRHISTERGHDPSDYTLVSFGGAGGLHACDLAEMLRIQRVLVPRYPGAFSALGLALADARRESVRSLFVSCDTEGEARVRAAIEELSIVIKRELLEEGYSNQEISLNSFVEMRYVGQSYALPVPFRASILKGTYAFHRAHRSRYGHSDRAAAVEVVAVGVAGSGSNRNLPASHISLPDVPGSPSGSSPVMISNTWHDMRQYRRADLALDQPISGPAVILQDDATTFIPPNWHGHTDKMGNLLLIPRYSAG